MPPHPDYVPQLATLVATPPSGDDWLHEIKYDGYRIGARIRKGHVSLYTRNGNDWTAAFPEIVDAVSRLGLDDAVIDGEVAVVLPDGRTSFQALQNTGGSENRGTLVYFVFDLLRSGGDNLADIPLEERKRRLKKIVGGRSTGRIRFSEHIEGSGDAFFAEACRAGLEGIVSKRRDEPYRPGRHGGWVKTKCQQRQEFVVGGFTDPEGMRAGIGALLIGYYEGERLVFSGKVGTGFTQKLAIDLRARLDRIEQKSSPFTPPPPGALGRNAHWVKPELVCEVVFTEWTSDGKIRHPSFQGLRGDKNPKEIGREKPVVPGPQGPRRDPRPRRAGVDTVLHSRSARQKCVRLAAAGSTLRTCRALHRFEAAIPSGHRHELGKRERTLLRASEHGRLGCPRSRLAGACARFPAHARP